MKTKLLLNFFISTLLLYQTISCNASINENKLDGLPTRDPFSPIATTHCFITQQGSLHPLKDWRLFGIVGQKDKWQSWVTNSQHQWLSLQKGDLLPNSDLAVAAITNHFTKFIPHSSKPINCEASDVIQLGFEE